jgi:hypothetical protein
MRSLILFLTVAIPSFLIAQSVSVTDIKSINLVPNASVGQIDLVTLILPVADASKKLSISEVKNTNSKRYKITNTSNIEVMLWAYQLRKAGDGSIFFSIAELMIMKPNESKNVTLTYQQSGKWGLYGEYRLIIAAAVFTEWGKYPTMPTTAAGEKISTILKSLKKFVEEANDKNKSK